jgi:excisionase family DNA binding protein
MTEPESIRTVATVTLALDELGPQTIDRLAELVAERLMAQRAAGAEPLLSTPEAAKAAGVHPETVRRAIKAGALRTVGYVGNRPRMRRTDVDDGSPGVHQRLTRWSRTGSCGAGHLVCVVRVLTRAGWARRCRR